MQSSINQRTSQPDLLPRQFAEWKCRFEDKKAAMLQAEREELGARSLQVHFIHMHVLAFQRYRTVVTTVLAVWQKVKVFTPPGLTPGLFFSTPRIRGLTSPSKGHC